MTGQNTGKLITIAFAGVMAVLLSGCWLRTFYGNVIYTSSTDETSNELLNAVAGDSTVAICRVGGTAVPPYGSPYDCYYYVEGNEMTSTFFLFGELGLFGVLIDPLILQVPADVITAAATVNVGVGVQPAIVTMRPSFEMTPRQFITAETGATFAIIEFPPNVTSSLIATSPTNGRPVSFDLTFTQRKPRSEPVTPTTVKAMLTAKVVTRGNTYYAPMLPCVTSFANVPSLTIPVSQTPVNLQTSIVSLLQSRQVAGCNRKVYDYSGAPNLLRNLVFIPNVTRRG